jgi:hypothetical protein
MPKMIATAIAATNTKRSIHVSLAPSGVFAQRMRANPQLDAPAG